MPIPTGISGSTEIIMYESGYYGTAELPKEIFDRLNPEFFISGCTDSVKYMCANEKEDAHLIGLGVTIKDICCDWFQLIKINEAE